MRQVADVRSGSASPRLGLGPGKVRTASQIALVHHSEATETERNDAKFVRSEKCMLNSSRVLSSRELTFGDAPEWSK